MKTDLERKAAEDALQERVQQMVAGWNQGNGQAFAAPFSDDADYVVVNGTYLKGRPAIAAGHQHIFETIYRRSHLEATLRSLRFLHPDIALLHLQCQVTFQGQGPAERTKREQSVPSIVAISQSNGWFFTAFHNTRVEEWSGR